jgi:hypothetical protein
MAADAPHVTGSGPDVDSSACRGAVISCARELGPHTTNHTTKHRPAASASALNFRQ